MKYVIETLVGYVGNGSNRLDAKLADAKIWHNKPSVLQSEMNLSRCGLSGWAMTLKEATEKAAREAA